MNIRFGSIIRPIVRCPDIVQAERETGLDDWEGENRNELSREEADAFVVQHLRQAASEGRVEIIYTDFLDTAGSQSSEFRFVGSAPAAVLMDDEEGAHATEYRQRYARLERHLTRYNPDKYFSLKNIFWLGPLFHRAVNKHIKIQQGYIDQAKPVEFEIAGKAAGEFVMVKNGLEQQG